MNEMYQIAESFGADWNQAVSGLISDSRVADSHVVVPGPDGKFGFGGHCFPKDLAAMIAFGSINNGETGFLEAVQEFNNKIRRIRDWEHMKGRAII